MTIHRVKTCGCGHEQSWHENGTGRCTYGHDHVMGGCTCERFGKRSRPDVPALENVALEETGAFLGLPAIGQAIDEVIRALATLKVAMSGVAHAGVGVPEKPRRASAPRATRSAPSATNGAVHLRAGERRLLEVAARHHPVRLTRAQLATLAGFTASGGTYQTYLSVLRRAAYINEEDRLVGVTAEGFLAAGVKERQPMTRAEVLEQWRGALRAGERTMLDVVLTLGSVTRAQLGAAANLEPSAGTFGTYLSVLKRNGLVAVDGKMVRLGKALAEAR